MFNSKKRVRLNDFKNQTDIYDERYVKAATPKKFSSSNFSMQATPTATSTGDYGDTSTGLTAGLGISITQNNINAYSIANSGVRKANNLTGDVTIKAGTGISINTSSPNITVAAKAGGGTVAAIDVSYSNTNGFYVSLGGTGTPVDNVEDALNVLEDTIGLTDNTGFIGWTLAGSAVYSFTASHSFCLQQGFIGYIKGKAVQLAATVGSPVKTKAMTKNSTTFICYNETSGLHNIDYTAVTDDTFRDNVILFEVLYDGTNKVVVRENHPYHFPTYVSRYIHENLAIIIQGQGALLTAKGTTNIAITGDDYVDDHGLEDKIVGAASTSIAINYYHTDGAGKWIRDTQSKTLPAKYNKSGTATALTAKSYGIYRIYVSKKDDKAGAVVNYFGIYDNSEYTNSTLAHKAITDNTVAQATNELMALELAQLGFVIVDSAGAISDIVIAKSSLRGVYANNTTNQAKLVVVDTSNFDKTLSSTDTTVQTALETLDENTVNLAKDQTIKGSKTLYSVVNLGVTGTISGVQEYRHKSAGTGVARINASSFAATYNLYLPMVAPNGLNVVCTGSTGSQLSYFSPTQEWHYHVSLTSASANIGTANAVADGALAIANIIPDVPRNLCFSLSWSNIGTQFAGTFSIAGVTCNGTTITETIVIAAFSPRKTIESNNAFVKVTSITVVKTNGAWAGDILTIKAAWWNKVGIGNYPFSGASQLIFAKQFGVPTTTFTLDATYGTILQSTTLTKGDINTYLVKSG